MDTGAKGEKVVDIQIKRLIYASNIRLCIGSHKHMPEMKSFERVIFRLLERLKMQFFLLLLAVKRFDPEGLL